MSDKEDRFWKPTQGHNFLFRFNGIRRWNNITGRRNLCTAGHRREKCSCKRNEVGDDHMKMQRG